MGSIGHRCERWRKVVQHKRPPLVIISYKLKKVLRLALLLRFSEVD